MFKISKFKNNNHNFNIVIEIESGLPIIFKKDERVLLDENKTKIIEDVYSLCILTDEDRDIIIDLLGRECKIDKTKWKDNKEYKEYFLYLGDHEEEVKGLSVESYLNYERLIIRNTPKGMYKMMCKYLKDLSQESYFKEIIEECII